MTDKREFKPLSAWRPLVEGERFEGEQERFGAIIIEDRGMARYESWGDCLDSEQIEWFWDDFTPLDRNAPELGLSNPDGKALADMGADQCAAVIKAFLNGDSLEVLDKSLMWLGVDYDDVDVLPLHEFLGRAYRVPPKVIPMSVDWEQVAVDFIAADEGGMAFGFKVRPVKDEHSWLAVSPDFECFQINGIIPSFNRGTIPWDKSLIERPKGE